MASLINLTGDSFWIRSGAVGDAGGMLGMMGGMMKMGAAQQEAAMRKQQGALQAQMYRTDEAQEMGAAERSSAERARADRQTIGTARTIAAAGGGGAGPTVNDILGEMAGRDAYARSSDIYAGEEKKRKLEDSARLAEYGADIGAAAARASGVSGLMSGAQSLFKSSSGGGSSLLDDSGSDSWDFGDWE